MYIKVFSCLLLATNLSTNVISEQWNGRINRYNQSYGDESWSNPYYGSYYDGRTGHDSDSLTTTTTTTTRPIYPTLYPKPFPQPQPPLRPYDADRQMPTDPYAVLPQQPIPQNGNDYDARHPMNSSRFNGNSPNQYNGNYYNGNNGNGYNNNYDPNQHRNHQATLPPFEGSGSAEPLPSNGNYNDRQSKLPPQISGSYPSSPPYGLNNNGGNIGINNNNMYAGNWNHTRQQNIPDGPNTYPGHHYNNFNSSSGNNNLYYNNNGSRPQPQPNPQYPNHVIGLDNQRYGQNPLNPANPNGYNLNPTNVNGYNQNRTNFYGYNPSSPNTNGHNPNSMNTNGYNQNRSNIHDYNPNPLNVNGYNQSRTIPNGYYPIPPNTNSYNPSSANSNGYNPATSSTHSYNPIPLNTNAYNQNRTNANGYNPIPTSASGYNQNPMNSNIYNSSPQNSNAHLPIPNRDSNNRSLPPNSQSLYKPDYDATGIALAGFPDDIGNNRMRNFNYENLHRRRPIDGVDSYPVQNNPTNARGYQNYDTFVAPSPVRSSQQSTIKPLNPIGIPHIPLAPLDDDSLPQVPLAPF